MKFVHEIVDFFKFEESLGGLKALLIFCERMVFVLVVQFKEHETELVECFEVAAELFV
jgi:hypothetical protein